MDIYLQLFLLSFRPFAEVNVIGDLVFCTDSEGQSQFNAKLLRHKFHDNEMNGHTQQYIRLSQRDIKSTLIRFANNKKTKQNSTKTFQM